MPARAAHQHVARVQHLGRQKPLHRGRPRCRSPGRSAAASSAAPRSSATIARPDRSDSARNPTTTARSSRRTEPPTTTRRRSARPAGSPTGAASSSGPKVPASRSTTPSRAISRPTRQSLDGYDLIVLVGHDEYWSAGQRATVERMSNGAATSPRSPATRRSGRCGSNPATTARRWSATSTEPIWMIRWRPMSSGACRACGPTRSSTGPSGSCSARDRRSGSTTGSVRPQHGVSAASSSYRDDHWMFADTGLAYGDVVGVDDGVVGYETVGCPLTFDDLQLPIAASHRRISPTTSRSSATPVEQPRRR